MKPFILPVIFILMAVHIASGQYNKKYTRLVREAFSLYQDKEYLKSGKKYAAAFAADGNKGTLDDRYNAACSWALAGRPDPAFVQLFLIANKGNYSEAGQLTGDDDLKPLFGDPRWEELIGIINANREKKEAGYNKKLKAILDTIFHDDQKYRLELSSLAEKFGWASKEIDSMENDPAFKERLRKADSINRVLVTAIIDTAGWLGAEVVGESGNSALFAVIQHSGLETQQKYLPVMREAVKKGKARADQLALLEDRVALREGRRQTYGSQLGMDPVTKKTYVCPLEDPVNVDVRRASVGLPPIQDYIGPAGIRWNAGRYLKELPAIEALEKKKNQKVP